ncbi:MAG: NAD+ synthase [Arenicellales bacterium]|nr:NAD+ synthase [Arenicellales bacterium]MDP7156108.1 NAD+ synthase [Arenicellales bacterium]MDP7481198.1 NAD+ synthase [Arenicellales bacterium]MEE1539898.1 NAD+ synthase [Arenicellales bacterium]HJL65861.1 NAD+ synthase [Arenicellales bacterium]
MTQILKIAVAQLNFRVGKIGENLASIREASVQARDEWGCQLILFPELALCGYPPEDLLLREDFLDQTEEALSSLVKEVEGITVVVGHPSRSEGALFNSASVIREGRVIDRYHKQCLPNQGVFDEKRYFSAGEEPCVVDIEGIPMGISICEDCWHEGPVESLTAQGAQLILNLNGSPFHMGKSGERARVVGKRAKKVGVPIIYANLVGGQDELVFDGGSFVVDRCGEVTQRFVEFEERIGVIEIDRESVAPVPTALSPVLSLEQSVYKAIVLGVRDYVNQNGFSGVVLGLSGGIDSALTLALAVDALGADRVEAVLMPSRYTAPMSIEDAKEEASLLGVTIHQVSIEPLFSTLLTSLDPFFAGTETDTTEENLQARCRGMILMAISNKRGSMVLTTGNKSEMAVGYATLYGDMAGGFAAIKDLPKMLVYRLADYRNSLSQVIPERVIKRPPSAELAPDQEDQDSLPPYPILDQILERYIELDQSLEKIKSAGFDPEVVDRVTALVDRNEYKRRQAAPGVRITQRAFGRDRRYPITSGFRR